ncbi:putative ribosomal Rna small subunit methyltransferase B [Cardiosporidium cionae]|uniref:Ribosomal Rna small subunit methyltransferase B n=1 Tax=Cardiosporidium cionae TaxID=476202 RepID=A0ABQ7JGA6_9APIC|nr:putative ribosomal Rna small subunit methyltransferase B [Cardiosporidium cionae]|eukprot:KAF8822964.1 putative ribosomal Rna small subunit methyltransferase B [Cardiosporidium cionae]
MNAFRVRHLENALNRFEQLVTVRQPVDIFLKHYFQEHKRMSSQDKLWIRDHTYELIRWKALLDHVSPPPSSWATRLRTYFISNRSEPFLSSLLYSPFLEYCISPNANGIDCFEICRWRNQTTNTALSPHLRCCFPEELFMRIEASHGKEKTVSLCNILNELPSTFLRVNTNRISRDRVIKFLISRGVTVEKCSSSPSGLVLGQLVRLKDLPEYTNGYIEIQDESSQLVGYKIEVKPGDKVLDYCAGSGGKTVVYGPKMEGSGKIYMFDIRKHILRQVRVIFDTTFSVIVDVPCTATGNIRRNPDVKWSYSDEWLQEIVSRQRKIVQQAIPYMKPTAKLVYVTSSILNDENSCQIEYFCEKHNLCLSEAPFHALPQSKGMDGFFCAILEKK